MGPFFPLATPVGIGMCGSAGSQQENKGGGKGNEQLTFCEGGHSQEQESVLEDPHDVVAVKQHEIDPRVNADPLASQLVTGKIG
jgi:hypothetical protein